MDVPLENDKWNKLLPYETDDPKQVFEKIKWNISRAVQQKDLTHSLFYVWCGELETFIKVHGYQFPKKDLVLIIKLFYSIITREEIDVVAVELTCKFYASLLRFRVKKFLTRDDLQLDWKPLYKTVNEVFFGKDINNALIALENPIRGVVNASKDYFSDESTREMLEEFEPLLCPQDTVSRKAVTMMAMFLPCTNPNPDVGINLWLDNIIGLMKTNSLGCPNLICSAAKFNIGKIDWKPHISWLFNVILNDLNLPVGESHTFAGLALRTPNSYHNMIETVIWSMGGDCTPIVFENLKLLMGICESYLHPSNRGSWTPPLLNMVNNLCTTFLKRVEMERHEQNYWFKHVPESHKLSDEDIQNFVKIIYPTAKVSMYNPSNSFQRDFQCLVKLAPDIVLPDFLQGVFDNLESVIEPQRVTTALCSFAVSLRSMCLHPTSKCEIIPLLQSLLPTISSNDLNKSWMALLAFWFSFTMIPIVDCSHLLEQPGKRKKETEKLWRATAQFKDIVAVFIDRLLSLIEISAMEDTGSMNAVNHKQGRSKNHKTEHNMPDYLAEGSIYMSFDTLLKNSSDDIRDMVLDKVFRYCTTSTLEVKVAGKMMGDALSNLTNIYTERSLKRFLPYLMGEINMALNDQPAHQDASTELLWNLTMLRSVLRGRADCFLPYLDDLLDLFERLFTFHNAKELIAISIKALSDLIYLLLKIKSKEFRSCQHSYDDKTFDFTQTWGVGLSSKDLKLDWYIPGDAEYNAVNTIVERFGRTGLKTLSRYVDEKHDCKEAFHVQLKVLHYILKYNSHIMPVIGADSELLKPDMDGAEVYLDKLTSDRASRLKCGIRFDTLSSLRTFRSDTAETIMKVYQYLKENCSDDTKSFEIIAIILENVLVCKGYDNANFKNEHTKYKSVKQMLDNKLLGATKQLRIVLIHRVYLQHQYRQYTQRLPTYTKQHHQYTQVLLELALSNYTVVRKTSQFCLRRILALIPFSAQFFLKSLVPYLKPDANVSHEQLKGAIFSLCIPVCTRNLLRKSSLCYEIVPLVCRAQHSEKDSIINTIEGLIDYIIDDYRMIPFKAVTCERTTKLAIELSGEMSAELIEAGEKFCEIKYKTDLDYYNKTIDSLLDIMTSQSTIWRFLGISGDLLKILIQKKTTITPRLVSTLLNFLTHDSIGMRRISICILSMILYLRRKKYKHTFLDPSEFPADGPGSQVGERPSNMWLQYRKDKLPDTEEKYNNFIFCDKPHWGFNKWPKQLKLCLEIDNDLGNPANYDEIDKLFVTWFSSPDNVSRFVSLYSIEMQKGGEKMDERRGRFYRDLFRNYGWSMYSVFDAKVQEFVKSNVESEHRFAAELIAHVVRGSKHWPFKDIQAMWDKIIPMITEVFSSVSSETLGLWYCCLSEIVGDRDPRRFSRLIDLANQEFMSGKTIFHYTSGCCLLEQIIAQFEWKYAEGLHELLDKVCGNLNNSYKNVRNILGHLIDRCLAIDNQMYGSRPTINPTHEDLTSRVLPLLQPLDESIFGTEWVMVNKLTLSDDNDSVKVIKTILSWFVYAYGRYTRCHAPLKPSVFPIITYVIALEPNEADMDLKMLASKCLAGIAHELLQENSLRPALTTVQKVIGCDGNGGTGCTWKAKCTALVYLQVMSFCNLYQLRLHPDIIADIQRLLLECLETSQVEVRQSAGLTFGGLLKIGLFGDQEDIIETLKKLAVTPLPKGTKKSQTDIKEVWTRHGAVTTLCALVETYPYSIPSWMPEILVFLAKFTRGNVMIANVVKRSMSNFKRTHLDNWMEHKTKFTEDQLLILQDLLVSPNYYA